MYSNLILHSRKLKYLGKDALRPQACDLARIRHKALIVSRRGTRTVWIADQTRVQSARPVLDYYVLFNLLVTLLYLIFMTTVRIF